MSSRCLQDIKEAVYNSLDNAGVLDTLRAQLRMTVYQNIDNDGVEREQNIELKKLVESESGKLMVELCADFMSRFGLHHSKSVLLAETGLSRRNPDWVEKTPATLVNTARSTVFPLDHHACALQQLLAAPSSKATSDIPHNVSHVSQLINNPMYVSNANAINNLLSTSSNQTVNQVSNPSNPWNANPINNDSNNLLLNRPSKFGSASTISHSSRKISSSSSSELEDDHDDDDDESSPPHFRSASHNYAHHAHHNNSGGGHIASRLASSRHSSSSLISASDKFSIGGFNKPSDDESVMSGDDEDILARMCDFVENA
eukprot:GDKJ01013424.1.p1 GENE.GDKJ01013424.1~~GDKJ01013424.1.p1  ORF type:complete len:315 (-),score=64.14 GDKJ01013424.1:86-1030(-)